MKLWTSGNFKSVLIASHVMEEDSLHIMHISSFCVCGCRMKWRKMVGGYLTLGTIPTFSWWAITSSKDLLTLDLHSYLILFGNFYTQAVELDNSLKVDFWCLSIFDRDGRRNSLWMWEPTAAWQLQASIMSVSPVVMGPSKVSIMTPIAGELRASLSSYGNFPSYPVLLAQMCSWSAVLFVETPWVTLKICNNTEHKLVLQFSELRYSGLRLGYDTM